MTDKPPTEQACNRTTGCYTEWVVHFGPVSFSITDKTLLYMYIYVYTFSAIKTAGVKGHLHACKGIL